MHSLTGCDTISSINGVGKTAVFKNLFLNKHLQEAALVFSASGKSHEEIESAGKKASSIISKGDTDNSLNSTSETTIEPTSELLDEEI